jgi:hypothetical protein
MLLLSFVVFFDDVCNDFFFLIAWTRAALFARFYLRVTVFKGFRFTIYASILEHNHNVKHLLYLKSVLFICAATTTV